MPVVQTDTVDPYFEKGVTHAGHQAVDVRKPPNEQTMTIAIANRNGGIGNVHSFHKAASGRDPSYTRSAVKSAFSIRKIMKYSLN